MNRSARRRQAQTAAQTVRDNARMPIGTVETPTRPQRKPGPKKSQYLHANDRNAHIQTIPNPYVTDLRHEHDEGAVPMYSTPSYQAVVRNQPSAMAHAFDDRSSGSQTAGPGSLYAERARAAVLAENYELLEGDPALSSTPMSLSGFIRLKPQRRSRSTRTHLENTDENVARRPADDHEIEQDDASTSTRPTQPRPSSVIPGPRGGLEATEQQADDVQEMFGDHLQDPRIIEMDVPSDPFEIAFTQHPTGDVTAHMWSPSTHHWTNIGQYSHMRNRIEGTLANLSFMGGVPPGKQSSEDATRAKMKHFKEMAYHYAFRQRSATQFQAHESRNMQRQLFNLDNVPTAPSTSRFGSLSSAGVRSSDTLPTLRNLRCPQESHANISPHRQALSDDPFVYAPAESDSHSSATDTNTVGTHGGGRLDFDYRFPQRDPFNGSTYNGSPSVRSADQNHWAAIYRSENRRREHEIPTPLQNLRGSVRTFPSTIDTEQEQFRQDYGLPCRPLGRHDFYSRPADPPEMGHIRPASEQFAINYLQQFVDQRNEVKPPRTVAYDPFQATQDQGNFESPMRFSHTPGPVPLHEELQMEHTPAGDHPAMVDPLLQAIGNLREDTYDSQYRDLQTMDEPMLPVNSPLQGSSGESEHRGRTATRDPLPSTEGLRPELAFLLQDSVPDTDYRNRQVDMITFQGGRTVTAEDMRMLRPQNFNGPFFVDDVSDGLDNQADNGRNQQHPRQWWEQNAMDAERHDAYYRAMTAPSDKRYNPVTTRVLLSVFESLEQHFKKPAPGTPRHPLMPYAEPPSHAIDTSTNGNKSLFGKDFGTQPERLGRDPRFRPFRFDDRYMETENDEIAPGGSLHRVLPGRHIAPPSKNS